MVGTYRCIEEVKGRDRNENECAQSNGLRADAETVISCRGPGPARKKKGISYQ